LTKPHISIEHIVSEIGGAAKAVGALIACRWRQRRRHENIATLSDVERMRQIVVAGVDVIICRLAPRLQSEVDKLSRRELVRAAAVEPRMEDTSLDDTAFV
jgi:hypothetical protein